MLTAAKNIRVISKSIRAGQQGQKVSWIDPKFWEHYQKLKLCRTIN